MNITELETKYKELGAEIARLKQAESDGKPKDGQKYWILFGDLGGACVCWCDRPNDNAQWDIGNVYLTKQEAVNAREFKLALVRINREIVRLNKLDGFVADWGNRYQKKHYPRLDYSLFKWVRTFGRSYRAQFTLEYGSQETIESVLKSHASDFDIVQKFGGV